MAEHREWSKKLYRIPTNLDLSQGTSVLDRVPQPYFPSSQTNPLIGTLPATPPSQFRNMLLPAHQAIT